MTKAEAIALLEITDENNDFDGIPRPRMMLKQSLGLAIEEVGDCVAITLGNYNGRKTLFVTARDGSVGAWFVDRTLNPNRHEDD